MDLSNVIAFRSNKTIYRDGDTVVKVFGEGFKKADVLNEALNHARVEETALHVPKLYGVGMIDGKWTITMEYIPGKTLAELMAEALKAADSRDGLALKFRLSEGASGEHDPYADVFATH